MFQNFQSAQIVAIVILLFFTVGASIYSAIALLTQDRRNPLPDVKIRTLWSVPTALWTICAIIYGSRLF